MRAGSINRREVLGAAALLAAGAGFANADQEEPDEPHGCITDVGGIRVGHFTDERRPTGCTVVLFDHGAVAGVDVRGSAPGTRETDLLQPINTVQEVNALVLSGGSAFGLETANGVMRWLEEHGQGYRVGPIVVPIVPAAILFDLQIGDPKIRPDARAGFAACEAATNSVVPEGSVGAGAGATVGKLFGLRSAMKSGLGTASIAIGDTGLLVGAIVAVNSVGDVRSYRTGRILAGARAANGQGFLDSMAQIRTGALLGRQERPRSGANTTIGIVATNAALTKTECTKVAQMAHDGYARTINPVHTPADGDTIFAAATGSVRSKADVTTIGAVAAEAMARAVNRAVITATGIQGYPAYRDLGK
ncbi:MAG: P1 family peptidase [Acidobacteriaceae bacterium]|nr:P1 family peptidase [Acidobacteriaceae bacterium]